MTYVFWYVLVGQWVTKQPQWPVIIVSKYLSGWNCDLIAASPTGEPRKNTAACVPKIAAGRGVLMCVLTACLLTCRWMVGVVSMRAHPHPPLSSAISVVIPGVK